MLTRSHHKINHIKNTHTHTRHCYTNLQLYGVNYPEKVTLWDQTLDNNQTSRAEVSCCCFQVQALRDRDEGNKLNRDLFHIDVFSSLAILQKVFRAQFQSQSSEVCVFVLVRTKCSLTEFWRCGDVWLIKRKTLLLQKTTRMKWAERWVLDLGGAQH